jgi:hypothetical protein
MRLYKFLDSLSDSEEKIIESELNIPLINLKSCLKGVDKDRLLDQMAPDLCLLHGSFHSPEIMWRKTSDGYTPLGVDWEGCRIGHPSEDLAFGVQNLLPDEEFRLFDAFIDSYTNELAACEIHTDREILVSIARREALIKIMDGVIPFLLQTYMRVRKDESYQKWCDWLKSSLPTTIHYLLNLISSDEIYTFSIPE